MGQPVDVVPRLSGHLAQVGAPLLRARAGREGVDQKVGPTDDVRGLRRGLAIGHQVVAGHLRREGHEALAEAHADRLEILGLLGAGESVDRLLPAPPAAEKQAGLFVHRRPALFGDPDHEADVEGEDDVAALEVLLE